MKCQKHNCEYVEVDKPSGFGQVGRLVCPKCEEEVRRLGQKGEGPEKQPKSAPNWRRGW